MAIRWNTTCPQCGKEESVFGKEMCCHKCRIKRYFKSQIKAALQIKRYTKEIQNMKIEIKKKLHDELLKEILAEEK